MATGLPTAGFVEIELTAGVWTNFWANLNQPVSIDVGRSDAASDSQPGVCTVVLENVDGALTPDNPLSTYYPNLVEGKRLRVRATKGSTATLFFGHITSIDPDYPSELNRATTVIVATDGLGDAAAAEKLDPGHAAVAKTYATAFWPCTDTSIANGCRDSLGALPTLTARYVSATSSFDFASDSSFSSDTDPCVSLKSGAMLWHAYPAFATDTTGTYRSTFGGLYLLPAGVAGEVFALTVGKRSNGNDLLPVAWDGTSTITSVRPGDTITVTGVAPGWHYIAVSWFGASVRSLTIDAATTNGVTSLGSSAFSCLSIGGGTGFDLAARDVFYARTAGSGTVDSAYLRAAFGTAATLDTAAADLATVIDTTALGITGGIAWTTANSSPATPLGSGGRTGLDVLLDLARSGGGIAYHDYATSTIKLLSEIDSRPTAVAMTVDAEADAIDGPALSRSNIAKAATWTAKSPVASVTLGDATVVGGTGETTTLLAAANDLYAAASSGLADGRDQRLRVKQFTVDFNSAQNDLYAAFFALTLGERIRYSVGTAASTYFGWTYTDGFFEGGHITFGPYVFEVTFDLSPADAPREGFYDTSRYCFGDGICTVTSGTAVGTTAVGTIVLTWTGAATLSTTAGDYPMDFNWNGERVTVTAAPAGGTSPRTLTITARGVAPTVARVHAANEAVDVWDADVFAL